tara:strand:- start:286 stop:534 length:249 start_codon:yes stop_codon:yes gene_type:complete
MKEQGIYEEHYFTSGTTGYDYEGYKITYNGRYGIICNGYTMGKFSGLKTTLYDYPTKSLSEAKHYLNKLKTNRKKFKFNLVG